jgi:hypothetical protein
MSSQGPSSGSRTTPTGGTGCYGPTGPSQVARGYKFSNNSLRDSSDWITYKKQLIILNENKRKVFQDPWFVRGNDYRLQFLQGRFLSPTGCTGCVGDAFNGNGPQFS